MNTKHQSYFCYLDQGTPVVLENKPSDFEDLPHHYVVCCPNPDIAERTLRCNLKIEKWRSES